MDKVCSRCDTCDFHPIAEQFYSEREHQPSRNDVFRGFSQPCQAKFLDYNCNSAITN
jgi:hypothetical protein